MRKQLLVGLFAAIGLASLANSVNATTIVNPSFESGLTGWSVQNLSTPFCTPLTTAGAGAGCGFGLFTTAPTNGAAVARNGFDGSPGTIRLGQDITVTLLGAVIGFDYRAGWDFRRGGATTSPRLFEVNIEVAGGGANLANFNILTTGTGPTFTLDTGNLTSAVDLSTFVGSTVRLSFDWIIPQDFTGPGHFQLDNITTSPGTAVPEPTTLTLFSLGLLGDGLARRRKKQLA